MEVGISVGEGRIYDEQGKQTDLGFVNGCHIFLNGKFIGGVNGSDEFSFYLKGVKSYRMKEGGYGGRYIVVEL